MWISMRIAYERNSYGCFILCSLFFVAIPCLYYRLISIATVPRTTTTVNMMELNVAFLTAAPVGEDDFSLGFTFFLKYSLCLPTTLPAGVYSHTTYQPCARVLPSGSLGTSRLSLQSPASRRTLSSSVYPQFTAAHPTSVVDFHTSCVKWPVFSLNPVGLSKL